MRDIDDAVSNERLEKLSEYDCADRYEVMSMATELLALRKERELAEPKPGRNPVLAYADSYREMAKRGVESIPVWSVITDLERNIAPLYTAPPAPVVPEEIDRSRATYDMIDHDESFRWDAASGYVHGWNACRAAMLNQK